MTMKRPQLWWQAPCKRRLQHTIVSGAEAAISLLAADDGDEVIEVSGSPSDGNGAAKRLILSLELCFSLCDPVSTST
jgi:hypothetical protein